MNNIIKEIRKKQNELIVMVNSTFDEIVKKVSLLDESVVREDNEYEVINPITNISGFKGKKVIAIILDGRRITTRTWKTVVETILTNAIQDEIKKKKLENLCDRLLGRTRTRLSTVPENMRSPLKIDEKIYVETHYDTETLMNLLLQILNEISYDYSNVKIVIKN